MLHHKTWLLTTVSTKPSKSSRPQPDREGKCSLSPSCQGQGPELHMRCPHHKSSSKHTQVVLSALTKIVVDDTTLILKLGCGIWEGMRMRTTCLQADLQREPPHNIPALPYWDGIRYVPKRMPGSSCSQNPRAFAQGMVSVREGKQHTLSARPSCARGTGSSTAKAVSSISRIKFTWISKPLQLIILKVHCLPESTEAETIRAYITVKQQYVT